MILAERYRLDALLGGGSTAEVWDAYDERLERQVALKLERDTPQAACPPAVFRTEAMVAARLNHPQIAALYDFGTQDGRGYLVMELIGRRSLADELKECGRVDVARAADIARQVASGLAATHGHGVVHQDIKPANLVVTEDGRVKIADFGIARCLDDGGDAPGGEATPITGTSFYLAPERALGRPGGPPCDMYALGCVLFELLTGRPPFRSDSQIVILREHVDTPPPEPRELRPDLPRPFAAHLLRMLAKDPAARPTAAETAEFFARGAWREHPGAARPGTAGAPVAAPAPAEAGRHRGISARRRGRALTSAASAGAVLMATALSFVVPRAGTAAAAPPRHVSAAQPDAGTDRPA